MENENSDGQEAKDRDFEKQGSKDRKIAGLGVKKRKSENQELRREKGAWRNRMEKETVERLSREVEKSLLEFEASSEAFRNCEAYLCYAPLRNEVCPENYYMRLLALGKKLYFPRTDAERMDFFGVSDLQTDLVPGNFGIREPRGMECYNGVEKAAALVPGVVFDCEGNRIGYGGGYYDRYFSRYQNIIKVGICYELQLTEQIAPEQWDVPMDAVITEMGVRFERSRRWN